MHLIVESKKDKRKTRDELLDELSELRERVAELEASRAERKRAEQELRQRTAQLEGLREVDLELTAELDLNHILQFIVSRGVELVGGTAGGFDVYDPDRDELDCVAFLGLDPLRTETAVRRGEGLAGKVLQTGEPLIVDDYQHWDGRMAVWDGSPVVAIVGVPVRRGEEFLGVLEVVSDAPGAFSSADAELLGLLAPQAAIAIRNARLHEEALRRAERLAAVNRVARAASGTLALDDLLEAVCEEITSIFRPDAFFVALYDEEANELDFRLSVDEGIREHLGRQSLGAGVTSLLVSERKPLLIRSLEAERDRLPQARLWGTMRAPESWLGVPMQIGEELIGVVSVQAYRPRAYDEEDQLLLSTIADQVALAVVQARLYEETYERSAQLEALREVGLELAAQLDLDDLLRSIVSRAVELLSATSGGIDLYRPEQDVLEWTASIGPNVAPLGTVMHRGEGVSGRVWQTGEPLSVDDYEHWEGRAPSWEGIPVGAIVGAPVRWGEEFLGSLIVQTDRPRTFSPADAELLSLCAAQAAVAIRNARLYDRAERRAAQAALIYEAGQRVSGELERDTLLSAIVNAVCDAFDYSGVMLLLRDRDVGCLTLQSIAGAYADIFPQDLRIALGEGMIGHAAATGETQVSGDVSNDPHYVRKATEETKSELAVPITSGHEVLGVLDLQDGRLGAFGETDVAAMETLSTQIASAIENARLFEEVGERAAELEALRTTGLHITASLDLSYVLGSIAEGAVTLVGATDSHIYLYDEESETFSFGSAFWEDGRREAAVETPRAGGLTATVAREGEPLVISDAPHHPLYSTPEAENWGIRAIAGFPLKRASRVLGAFTIAYLEEHTFSDAELRLLGLLADQAAIAIDNARLFEAEREQRELAEALQRAAAAVGSTLELDQVLDSILEQVERVVAGDAFNIMLVEDDTARAVRSRGYETLGVADEAAALSMPITKYPSLVRMAESGEPIVVPDTAADPDWVSLEGWESLRSYVGAPIKLGGLVVGFLNVDGTRPGQFGVVHGERLQAFAVQAATAVENARLYRELRVRAEQLEERVQERTAQLQAEYARVEAILGSTADGVIVTDGEGEILQANPIAERWLTQTLSPKDAGRLREAVRELAAGMGAEAAPGELPRRTLPLKGLDLELSAAPVVGEGVEEPKVVVALHDVSHLRALDRMKSRFVTNISHELRTPITTIQFYAYLMKQQPEAWEDHLAALAREADHQVDLVEDILEVSRIDAGRLEVEPHPVSVNQLTQATWARHDTLAEKQGVTLEYGPAEPGPVALVDRQQIVQALNNLVRNAIQYTPEGGRVVISTGTEEGEDRTWATVTVADTGMGIPEDELPHVFDRFFRGEEPRAMQLSGSGLGLAIAEEIVELHGGTVSVDSEEGTGSTFTVWLPLAD